MKASFVLLAVIAASAICVANTKAFDTVINKYANHPYGQSLGSLIQMHTSVKDDQSTLATIEAFLESLQGDILEKQASDKTECDRVANNCAVQIPALTNEIGQYKATNENNAEELKQLQEELKAKQGAIQQKNSEIEQTGKAIEEAQKQLESNTDNFNGRALDFNAAINACKEAIGIIDKIQSGYGEPEATMFLQVSDNFAQIHNLFEKEVNLDKSTRAFIQPISDVLVQLGTETNINIEKVAEVRTLIQLLLDTLTIGYQDAESEHGRKQKFLEEEIPRLQKQLETLHNEVDILDGRIEEINKRIKTLQGLIDINTDFISTKSKELEALKTSCPKKAALCQSIATKTQSELDIINEFLQYFRENVKQPVQDAYDINA